MTAPIRTMPELIDRQEAVARGLPRYFTGVACLRGHVSERLIANGRCWSCWRLWYEANTELRRERQRNWRVNNPEKYAAYVARGADKNRMRQRERARRMSAALKALEDLGIEV